MTQPATKTALILAGFCLGGIENDVYPGDLVELDLNTYNLELDRGRIKTVASDEDEAVKAAALQQAHAELLEQIGAAATVDDLERLLSEDPEIIAAYEKRLQELDEPHH